MNILINCSNIKMGGGIQVAHSFINELRNLGANHQFVLVISPTLQAQLDMEVLPYTIVTYLYEIEANPINAVFSKNKFLDGLVLKHHIDRVFTVFGPSYWRPAVKHICGYAKPHYVYTDSPFFGKISPLAQLKLKLKGFFHLHDFKKNADILITENPDVSSKIGKRLNKKTHTVSNNYHQIFDDNSKWVSLNLPDFDGKYLLTISANYPHKNLYIIPQVIEELLRRKRTDFKFVVTLEQESLTDLKEINDYIVYLGKVIINQCPSLYAQTEFMFLPTLLECFSASYAEAMRMERPILTSDLDFAKGICQNAAVYFDPLNAKSIADKIIETADDRVFYDQITVEGNERLKSFDTSKERAIKYLNIITES